MTAKSKVRPLFRDCVIHDYSQIVTVLATARQDQGVSLSQLAQHTDCGRSTLSENLRSQHRMDALTLLQVADALGFDLALVPREPS